MLGYRSTNFGGSQMSATKCLKPLYAPGQDGSDDVVLRGGACECGFVFFPMQTYGCEVCGRHGSSLQPRSLKGRGVLVASAAVHTHADKNRPTPFTIVEVALDDGPTIRTLLADGTADPPPGAPVRAVLVPAGVSETGDDLVDLRFVAVGG
jgi:uncharacterized OB-fold protein